MTKVRILALLAGMVLLFIVPAAVFAQAPPPPATFDGMVSLDGEPAADGTMITAMIGDSTEAAGTATVVGGMYYIIVAQPPGENFDNQDVHFMVGEAMATEVGTWKGFGDNRDFALTAMMGAMEEPIMEEGAGLALGLFGMNSSGVSGRATLTEIGLNTEVILSINRGALNAELVHIHSGQCGETLGGVDYGLASFVGGSGGSTTLVEAGLAMIQDGDHAINIHEAGSPGNYIACGNIPATGEDQPRPMPKAMAMEAGEAGEAGSKGATGSAGPKGDAGGTGLTGSPGSRGAAGNTGATGAAGADGANGTNGTAGAQGPPGSSGNRRSCGRRWRRRRTRRHRPDPGHRGPGGSRWSICHEQKKLTSRKLELPKGPDRIGALLIYRDGRCLCLWAYSSGDINPPPVQAWASPDAPAQNPPHQVFKKHCKVLSDGPAYI